jgi:hypothetical protein
MSMIREHDSKTSVFSCRVSFHDIRLDAARRQRNGITASLILDNAVVDSLVSNTYAFPICLEFTVSAFAASLPEFLGSLENAAVHIEGEDLRAVGLDPFPHSPVVEIRPDMRTIIHHDLGHELAA